MKKAYSWLVLSLKMQKLRDNNTEPDEIVIKREVTNRAVLGPLLFNLYLNDMGKHLEK